jgi:hypothetical protein
MHRTLLAALNVDYFPPGMREMNDWRDWLSVMAPLKDSTGGAFTKDDLTAAVRLMRDQNRSKEANWSLRFSKIMREPESFRDIVLLARKQKRPRAPIEQRQRTDATGANIAVDHDPATEREAIPIAEHIDELRRKLRMPKKERQS